MWILTLTHMAFWATFDWIPLPRKVLRLLAQATNCQLVFKYEHSFQQVTFDVKKAWFLSSIVNNKSTLIFSESRNFILEHFWFFAEIQYCYYIKNCYWKHVRTPGPLWEHRKTRGKVNESWKPIIQISCSYGLFYYRNLPEIFLAARFRLIYK